MPYIRLRMYLYFRIQASSNQYISTFSVACVLGSWVSASSEVLYENEDLYEDGDCMRICIRTRVMRLMLDRAYAYAYGRLYIYGLWPSR